MPAEKNPERKDRDIDRERKDEGDMGGETRRELMPENEMDQDEDSGATP